MLNMVFCHSCIIVIHVSRGEIHLLNSMHCFNLMMDDDIVNIIITNSRKELFRFNVKQNQIQNTHTNIMYLEKLDQNSLQGSIRTMR